MKYRRFIIFAASSVSRFSEKKPKSLFFRRKCWKKSTEAKVRPRMNNGEEKKVGRNPSEGQDGHSSSSLRNNRAETSSGKKTGTTLQQTG